MRMLLIEDDRRISRFLEKGLREESHTVTAAADGEEGLHFALHHEFDLVILDLMLPKIDGEVILKEIRKAGLEVPVLALTAKDAVADRVRVLDAGADDYLCKPFSLSELSARIRALLRRSLGSPHNQLKVADLVVDPMSRRVTRGGQPVELTAKEFSLLQFLAQNAGHVLTRSAISDQVWGEQFESFSNVIDVHVNRLRRKIDQDRKPRLLHTVRGVGYVLRADG